MKTFLAVLMLSTAALAQDPADAPKAVVLTPDEAKAEAVRVLTCESDLKDCQAAGKLEPKWLVVGVVSGVIAGVAIGFAAGFAWKR